MDRLKYVAEARRVGSWWAIDVPGVLGAHTQAKRLNQVPAMARDVLVALTDADPRAIEIEVRPLLGPGLGSVVTAAVESRQRAQEMERKAATVTRDAITGLLSNGLSLRDVGGLLGVSHQRVAQLSASDSHGRVTLKPVARHRADVAPVGRHRTV